MRGNVITVSIYGSEHQAAAAAILTNLNGKLSHVKIYPRISWLGNRGRSAICVSLIDVPESVYLEAGELLQNK